MYRALMNVLNNEPGKRIVILTHSTAMLNLLRTWCDIQLKEKLVCKFNNHILFEGNMDCCEAFKLTFNETKEITNIENIK